MNSWAHSYWSWQLGEIVLGGKDLLKAGHAAERVGQRLQLVVLHLQGYQGHQVTQAFWQHLHDSNVWTKLTFDFFLYFF